MRAKIRRFQSVNRAQYQRAAAGQQYAIIVGLIAVIAIAAVVQLGSGVRTLLGKTGNTLSTVVNQGGSASTAPSAPPDCNAVRVSCKAHLQAGCVANGAYAIDPDGAGAQNQVNLYCDMTTDGGGWTLFAKNSNTVRNTFTGNSTTGYQVSNLSNLTTNDGAIQFSALNTLFQTGDQLMRYTYNGSHIAYYKRVTSPGSYDFANAFFNWTTGNAGTLGTDFQIYSSLSDLQADQNRWTNCNYDPTITFPRDCGPSSLISNRWMAGTSAPSGWNLQAWVR